MKIVWNEQAVRWFHNASEYTGYNKKLAELLLERIPCRKTLCDIGCGAGFIDMELSPYFERITCIDISPEAVNSLEARTGQLGISNISALCMDGEDLSGEWDTVIALFHGGAEVFSKYLHLAKDRLILVTHGDKKGKFGPEERRITKCFDADGFKSQFDTLGIRYNLYEAILEYGQPFVSITEAEDFVRAYTTSNDKTEIDLYLEQNLEKTNDEKFPYYLPNPKKIGIFVIRRDENENI